MNDKTSLDTYEDGLKGTDLGIIGAFQYALDTVGNVYRRAAEAGTYGGWHWECQDTHPAQHAGDPVMAALAQAIARNA